MRGRGGLQRFERVGVEEKSLKSYEQNAVLIHPWRFVSIASDDNFAERVTDIAKGAGLLGLRVKKHTFGKATEQEVRFHDFPGFRMALHQRVEFGKGKRRNLYDFASPSELRYYTMPRGDDNGSFQKTGHVDLFESR